MNTARPVRWRRLLDDYAMLGVLLALCALLAIATIEEQQVDDPAAGQRMVEELTERVATPRVLVAADDTEEHAAFLDAVHRAVDAAGGEVLREVRGSPRQVRLELESLLASGVVPDAILSVRTADSWSLLQSAPQRYPELRDVEVLSPSPERRSVFLTRRNLINITEKIVVWAVIAIGVTLVILTAGIDLSVGSLVALSSVITALMVQKCFGGVAASPFAVFLASLCGIVACGIVGLLTGLLVTTFGVAPFIVTLGMMMAASGLALGLTNGQSIDAVPNSFGWLGHSELLGLPTSVWLMVVLYGIAHAVMSHTALGRAIYAIGGNPETARLAGVPVKRVLLMVYCVSGLLAGVGGVLTASTFESGDPNYGQTYELYVIAAVVVGGTSLAGGEGRVLGTLVGALILGVIYNGMNLLSVSTFSQRIVLGGVILLTVVLDRLKKR